MASSALLSRISQNTGPCKPHLLALPFEIRREILELACAAAYMWFEIKYNYPNPQYYVEGGGPEEFAILMSCSQLYSETLEILSRSTWLDISCDIWSIDRLDFRASMVHILWRSPRTPGFIRKSRHFIEYVRFSEGISNARALKQSDFWLDISFPCLKTLHIDKVDFFDRWNKPKELQPRTIAEECGQSKEWIGHLALTGYGDGVLFLALQALKSLKGRTLTITLKTDLSAICAEHYSWRPPEEILSVSYYCCCLMRRIGLLTAP
jgi:hypothetical protein